MTAATLLPARRIVDVAPEPAGASLRAHGWLDLLEGAAEIASTIAGTTFVPAGMRDDRAAITACILYGDEIGLAPMVSLAWIVVVEGRPRLYAEAQRALVLAAGHEIWPEAMNSTSVTWCGKRADSDRAPTKVTWTMDRARKAGLAGKPTYVKYPEEMLSARASAQLVRAIFGDVVGGLAAVEEADEYERADAGADAAAAPDASPRSTRRRRAGKAAAVAAPPAPSAPAAGPPRPPLPHEREAAQVDDVLTRAEQASAGATSDDASAEAQRDAGELPAAHHRKLMAAFGAAGYSRKASERDRRLALIREVIGSDLIQSSKELTPNEADAVIRYLRSQTPADDQQGLDV